ncbi:MAG: Na/Pi cotransporter family protein [Phycisphaerae bacterium]
MLNLVQILSGIALILFGVTFLRKGLDRIFGPRLSPLIESLAGRPGHAFLSGVGMGMAVPSSTSTAVLVTETVQASRLTAGQAFPLVLGVDIGLTVLVLVASLHLEQVTTFLVVAGVGLYQFTRGPYPRGIGQVLLGMAFVLMASMTIKPVGVTLAGDADVAGIVHIASHYPWALAFFAAAMAIGLQSSTATVLLLAGLGSAFALDLPLTLIVVFGANIGITVTRLAISWRVLEARRLAVASLLARSLTALTVAVALAPAVQLIRLLPVPYALQVAFMHVGFNLLGALVGILLAPLLIRLAGRWVVASANPEQQVFGPRYINDGSIDTPSLALGQSLREILRASEIVREMLADVWRALETGDGELARAVSRRDDQVDLLDRELKRFLTHIAGQDMDSLNAREQMQQLRFLSEIESIGDIVDKNISELVLKKLSHRMQFSEAGWQDLQGFFKRVQENMLISETAFTTRDRKLAAQLLRHKEWLNCYHRQLADRHLARLTAGAVESHQTSAVHLDLLANLKRINSCLSHVAYTVLSGAPDGSGVLENAHALSAARVASGS